MFMLFYKVFMDLKINKKFKKKKATKAITKKKQTTKTRHGLA